MRKCGIIIIIIIILASVFPCMHGLDVSHSTNFPTFHCICRSFCGSEAVFLALNIPNDDSRGRTARCSLMSYPG